MTIVVNFFGGSGVGKSTLAANVFSILKKLDIEAEFALEFAKDLVWEENFTTLKNQLYVFGNQVHRVERLNNKVEVVITDSPILLSSIFKPKYLSKTFDDLVLEVFNTYNNLNYFIKRTTTFNPNGRVEKTVEEAIEKDNQIKKLLNDNNVKYKIIENDETDKIISDIINNLYGYRGII